MTADWAGRDIVIGSLFSGFGGLDDGSVRALLALGARSVRVAWVADIDPGASRILAHRYPDIPNLGDITAANWTAMEPVDVVTGGFPCQDVSLAGNRAGLRPDTRSGLWAHMCYAVSILRPQLMVAENVRGLLSAPAHSDVEPCPWCLGDANGEPPVRALGAVLADLADIGYDARWQGLRASDVGAPHARGSVVAQVLLEQRAQFGDVGGEFGDGGELRGERVGDESGAAGLDDEPAFGRERPEGLGCGLWGDVVLVAEGADAGDAVAGREGAGADLGAEVVRDESVSGWHAFMMPQLCAQFLTVLWLGVS